eukprot:13272498-Heterocapsa_arctica.AAC.1
MSHTPTGYPCIARPNISHVCMTLYASMRRMLHSLAWHSVLCRYIPLWTWLCVRSHFGSRAQRPVSPLNPLSPLCVFSAVRLLLGSP